MQQGPLFWQVRCVLGAALHRLPSRSGTRSGPPPRTAPPASAPSPPMAAAVPACAPVAAGPREACWRLRAATSGHCICDALAGAQPRSYRNSLLASSFEICVVSFACQCTLTPPAIIDSVCPLMLTLFLSPRLLPSRNVWSLLKSPVLAASLRAQHSHPQDAKLDDRITLGACEKIVNHYQMSQTA